MHLKRLESVGFKSFAERINIEFVKGVTAVVGPNGSGKSNITDAIRWVLGEQSVKSLRGTRMEDIIFQGSDTRRPLNFAEVKLVLDNTNQTLPLDYDEVSITRRVYRSGTSEFYINKQSCRLKDIIDLFMDSGLGKEAFSIISQGKVEEILSSKAEDRRTIFEEAAGVLKYKHRKIKAEYKLAETDENLNRVEDIVYEIEQQIQPLKAQAETATIYLKKKELLKKEDISLLVTEIEHLHEKWQTLLTQLDEEKAAEVTLKTAIQKKGASLEYERLGLQKLDEDIESLQTSLLEATQKLEQTEGKKQVLHERLKHLTKNKENLEKEKDKTVDEITQLKKILHKEKQKLSDLQQMRDLTNTNLKKTNAKLNLDRHALIDQIEELKSELIEQLNKQAAKRNERQTITTQLHQLQVRMDRHKNTFEHSFSQQDELTKKKREINTEYQLKNKQYVEKEAHTIKLNKELNHMMEQYELAQSKLNKEYQSMATLKSRKDMLAEMKEDFQGFFHGVKAVLKGRHEGSVNNVHGAVIELIDVPKEFITSIETVLGGQAQHIVVQHDKAARDAIDWLKQTNQGRATFLPLRSIQPRYLSKHLLEKIENQQGFIGMAAHVVKTDKKYEHVVHHLMGHVIIAKTLGDANEIAKVIQRRNRIVTLDGDVVHPGGSMSGGARRRTNQSLFTREKDLEQAIKALSIAESNVQRFEQQVTKLRDKIKLTTAKAEDAKQTLNGEQQVLHEIEASYKEVSMELGSVIDQIKIQDQDHQQFNHDQKQLNNRDGELVIELDLIEQQVKAMRLEIETLTEQEAAFKENQEQTQAEFQQYQVSFAEQEERLRSQREKTSVIQKQLSEAEEQLATYTADLNELLNMQKMNYNEESIVEQIQVQTETKENVTTHVQERRADRSKRTQLMHDLDRELKEENKKHNKLMQTIQHIEVTTNRLDVDLENRLSHLQTEYTITYEKAMQTYEKTNDVEETKNNLKKLKFEIEQLGIINLGAIDEHERISERYTFLMDQKNDLDEAKETLFSIIAEMDKEMKERFETTFTQIRNEFTIVFRELFGGGHAELNLTDPNNILDTGIEIVAQPPGKNLQQLRLLSGGERALTAIALLFSILRVRPVPFCVLDEVESALDEANVVLFAKYVKHHSADTQFIVITHRKGTMEEADVLYGVTMQEPGVSRLVSVRLEDSLELINS